MPNTTSLRSYFTTIDMDLDFDSRIQSFGISNLFNVSYDSPSNETYLTESYRPVVYSYDACSYGDPQHANRIVLIYQCVQILSTLSFATFLMNNSYLYLFYKPLARIVDFAIVLKFLSFMLYIGSFPYVYGEGNCLEIFTGRLAKSVIMIGEMHQVYLLAHVLGLSRIRLSFLPKGMSFEVLLNILSLTIMISFVMQYLRMEVYVLTFGSVWEIVIAYLQLYMISYAKVIPISHREHDLISPRESSIQLFEKLSKLQIVYEMIVLIAPIIFASGIFSYKLVSSLEVAILVLDEVCIFLFFIKILIVTLKSNVSIEMA